MKKIIFLFLLIIMPFSLFCAVKKNKEELDKIELNTKLIAAIRQGEFNLVEKLIKAGAQTGNILIKSPHYKDYYKKDNALLQAVIHNHTNIVELLLALGSDPNVYPLGTSLLTYAVKKNNPEIVKLLINSGANLEAGGFRGFKPNKNPLTGIHFTYKGKNYINIIYEGPTALEEAVRFEPKDAINEKNNFEIIETLLKAGKDPNAHNLENILTTAAKLNKEETFKLLLQYGANPETKGIDELNFFDYLKEELDIKKPGDKEKQAAIQKYKEIMEEYKKNVSKNLKESLPEHMPKELIDIIASYVFKS